LFELNLKSNLNFGDDNENELIKKHYLPINIENLLELYFEPYYKVEMQNYLIELCLGILTYIIKNSDYKIKSKNYLDPDIHHDLIL
jgi:hypothetical protein